MSKFVRNFEALDATDPYDVCVIGAGISGSVLALKLVRSGLRVLIIESAASFRRDDTSWAARYDMCGDANYCLAPAPRKIGGGSNVWNGICERLERADFRGHPYNRRSTPWPLSYTDLEPHYGSAEQLLRVRQTPTRFGTRVPIADRRHADPDFEALLRRHGIDAKTVARATPGSGRAAFTMSRELLPELLASRRGTLASGVTATRLRTDANGRVIGAVCRTPDGTSKTARAQTFVIAAGAVDTPRLLLLSRSQRFPLGLGNDFDCVGRGFSDQATVAAYGLTTRLAGRRRTAAMLHTEQFHQMFRRDGLGAVHPFFERIGTLKYLRGLRNRPPGRPLVAAFTGADTLFSMSARIEMMPSDSNRVALSGAMLDVFGDPCARLVFDYSAEDLELIARTRAWLDRWLDRLGAASAGQSGVEWAGSTSGTCRMGVDPRTSVCDASLRVHASPNLYLCGAETFPRAGAVPPALTIAALAHRLADHIAARARWCSRAPVRPKRSMAAAAPAAPIPLVRRRPQP